jgi:hypothetical protein
VHEQVQCGLLLQHRRHHLYCLCRWKVLHRCRQLHLHTLRLRSLPTQHRPDLLQRRVRPRNVLQHWGFGLHSLPSRKVRIGNWHMHLHQLRLRPLPTSQWSIVVHRDVRSRQVLWHRSYDMHELPSWPVCCFDGHVHLHLLRCWSVSNIDGSDVLLQLRLRHIQQQHRAHVVVHFEVHCWLFFKRRCKDVFSMPRRTLLDNHRHVHLLILRLWHLQHLNRQVNTLHKQVRHRPVFEHGCRRMLFLPSRYVLDDNRRVRLRCLPSRPVSTICGEDVLLQLRLRNVQHQHRPHHCMHGKVRHWVLFWLRRHRMHRVPCR